MPLPFLFNDIGLLESTQSRSKLFTAYASTAIFPQQNAPNPDGNFHPAVAHQGACCGKAYKDVCGP
jgi:hypothetical protein